MPLLVSCTNRKRPEIITIVEMMITANGSASSGSAMNISVIADMAAKQNKMAVNGLTKAFIRRCDNDIFLP